MVVCLLCALCACVETLEEKGREAEERERAMAEESKLALEAEKKARRNWRSI